MLLKGRPKFPEEERMYMMDAIRYVDRATLVTELADRDGLPDDGPGRCLGGG